jgi:DNA-binding NarL/FixJ family response regulator
MHNWQAMRILIADRNGWLLESISHTFARQFRIEAATSHEQCNELLRQGEFDLVVISEKLADGPGLHLLARIARSSPDTLRVFAARRSRLQLLKGKLGPFGLFRTLSYPINPRELLSVLTLSCAGLETEMPVMEAAAEAGVRRRSRVAAPQEKAAAAAVKSPAAASVAASAPKARPSAERISFVRAAALISINVPEMIGGNAGGGLQSGAMRVAREIPRPTPAGARQVPPEISGPTPAEARQVPREISGPTPAGARQVPREISGPAPAEAPRQAPGETRELRQAQSQSRDNAPEVAQPRSPAAAPPAVQPPGAPRRPDVPSRAQMLPRPESPLADLPHMVADPFAPASLPFITAERSPRRARIVFGATVAAVFLATTFAISLLGGGVHESQAAPAVASEEVAPAPVTAPTVAPVGLTPAFTPAPKVPQHAPPKPEPTEPDVEPTDSRVAASATPVADPSTFGSEAYEAIYSN